MKMTQAIDAFITDMRRKGRIRFDMSEVAYRQVLENHAEDVGNRDPRTIGREDIKRTLPRWPHPNTSAKRHSILASSTAGACSRRSATPTRPNRCAAPRPCPRPRTA